MSPGGSVFGRLFGHACSMVVGWIDRHIYGSVILKSVIKEVMFGRSGKLGISLVKTKKVCCVIVLVDMLRIKLYLNLKARALLYWVIPSILS